MRHIIPISGKDSLATAFVQQARQPDLPYEYIFCDVSAELPETYEWLDRVRAATGWGIVNAGKNLLDIIDGFGGFLPSTRQRYCTREAKIEPMEKLLGGDPAMVYYGLRADEQRVGYVPLGKSNIVPAYPLRDTGIDLRGVYAILDAKGLMPPTFFYPRLYNRVCELMAGLGEWESRLGRTERTALFSGRSRGNCFFCFFQRMYEWTWLYETHPDLFARAEAMEKEEYTFRQERRLSAYHSQELRDGVIEARARHVAKIAGKRLQLNMFEFEDGEIAATSCGLLCGK